MNTFGCIFELVLFSLSLPILKNLQWMGKALSGKFIDCSYWSINGYQNTMTGIAFEIFVKMVFLSINRNGKFSTRPKNFSVHIPYQSYIELSLFFRNSIYGYGYVICTVLRKNVTYDTFPGFSNRKFSIPEDFLNSNHVHSTPYIRLIPLQRTGVYRVINKVQNQCLYDWILNQLTNVVYCSKICNLCYGKPNCNILMKI
jgi:hypothetical protein